MHSVTVTAGPGDWESEADDEAGDTAGGETRHRDTPPPLQVHHRPTVWGTQLRQRSGHGAVPTVCCKSMVWLGCLECLNILA